VIASEIQTGKKLRMQTIDTVLLQLDLKGEIASDTAASYARGPSRSAPAGPGKSPAPMTTAPRLGGDAGRPWD
jgi:hypothetical protein